LSADYPDYYASRLKAPAVAACPVAEVR
jgi:hypothetical protein